MTGPHGAETRFEYTVSPPKKRAILKFQDDQQVWRETFSETRYDGLGLLNRDRDLSGQQGSKCGGRAEEEKLHPLQTGRLFFAAIVLSFAGRPGVGDGLCRLSAAVPPLSIP